jgi:hypothetical protein
VVVRHELDYSADYHYLRAAYCITWYRDYDFLKGSNDCREHPQATSKQNRVAFYSCRVSLGSCILLLCIFSCSFGAVLVYGLVPVLSLVGR